MGYSRLLKRYKKIARELIAVKKEIYANELTHEDIAEMLNTDYGDEECT